MKSNIISRGLCLFSVLISSVVQAHALNTDPFHIPQHQSCEVLASELLSQLYDWQFVGHIYSSHSLFLSAVLTDDETWIIITNDSDVPDCLRPWSISELGAWQIKWQVKLPDYCEYQLTRTMKFVRKTE